MKNPLLIFPPFSSHKSEIDLIEDKIKHVTDEFVIATSAWPLADAMFNVGMEYGRYLAQNGMELKTPKFFACFYKAYEAWEEASEARTTIGNSLKELFRYAIGLELRHKGVWRVHTPLSGPAPSFGNTVETYLTLKSVNFVHDTSGNFRWILHLESDEENYLGDFVTANFQVCIANPDKQDILILNATDWNSFCDKHVSIKFESDEFFQEETDTRLAAQWMEGFVVMAKLRVP